MRCRSWGLCRFKRLSDPPQGQDHTMQRPASWTLSHKPASAGAPRNLNGARDATSSSLGPCPSWEIVPFCFRTPFKKKAGNDGGRVCQLPALSPLPPTPGPSQAFVVVSPPHVVLSRQAAVFFCHCVGQEHATSCPRSEQRLCRDVHCWRLLACFRRKLTRKSDFVDPEARDPPGTGND